MEMTITMHNHLIGIVMDSDCPRVKKAGAKIHEP